MVEAVIKYVPPGTKAVFCATDRARSSWPVDERRVTIHDMRPFVGSLAIERNGFVLLKEPTVVASFYDADEVKRIYYPEIQALVKRLTGAKVVVAFGEVARSDRPGTPDGRLPAWGAHVDYGERTLRDFARHLLSPGDADRLLSGRFMLVNLWRPIRPVERTPLALCDASTVAAVDLNDSEVRGGLNDPTRPSLYGFNLSYSAAHRWYYAPRMQPDEMLAFKLFDTESDRIQWTAHTAFGDPSASADAPPRESIEIRTLAFFKQ